MTPLQLRTEADDLAALVDAAARARGLPQAFVEKDFWVIEVLRAATASRTVTDKNNTALPITAVFKGGTSLSRGFSIIERFSEDVDLLLGFPDNCSAGAKDKVLKDICTVVGDRLGLGPESLVLENSSKGVKRNMRYHFPAVYGDHGITEGVLLEMGTRGGTFPTETKHIRSIAAEHALEVLGQEESEYEEYAAVTVEVLSPERTLLEKLAAVHDAVTRLPDERAHVALERGGRHFYDIHCLLNDDRVVSALSAVGQVGVARLVDDIGHHSESAGFPFTERPADGYAASRAFTPDQTAMPHMQSSYDLATRLIYGNAPTLEECLATARTASHLI
ncbi:nucleotidyl transferase AbiEii/AbiGii toxin family protein [Paenarthrobacter sp. NPDC056912]|uniref:nucleotidyl transferase AbiEii/AbiGii toxin family protein n=1 Tax=Paenarthrobacter sp. NPDC056912 TaxID=3345965 RepID=UPI00366D9E6D